MKTKPKIRTAFNYVLSNALENLTLFHNKAGPSPAAIAFLK